MSTSSPETLQGRLILTDEMNGENIRLPSSNTLEVDDKKNRRSRPPSQ